MGAPKQKWSPEEESALRAGVKKYGAGKWSTILKDPEFSPCLSSRSNIDLKDKWRNMCVSAGGQSRIPKLKGLPPIPSSGSQGPVSPLQVKLDGPSTHMPDSPAQLKQDGLSTHKPASPAQFKQDGPSTHMVSSKNLQDGKIPRYSASASMIIEALTAMHEPNGVEIGAIRTYIEQKHETALDTRLLCSKLRRLVTLKKIEKGHEGFKLKEISLATTTRTPALKQKDPSDRMKPPQQSELEELAANAAYKVADADAKSFLASEAVKVADRVRRINEETDCLLMLAREIFGKCSQGQIITMG